MISHIDWKCNLHNLQLSHDEKSCVITSAIWKKYVVNENLFKIIDSKPKIIEKQIHT